MSLTWVGSNGSYVCLETGILVYVKQTDQYEIHGYDVVLKFPQDVEHPLGHYDDEATARDASRQLVQGRTIAEIID